MKSSFLIGIVLIVCLAIPATLQASGSTRVLAKVALECARISGDERRKCYERVIPQLYPEYSIEEIFGLIRMLQKHDSGFFNCHAAAHELGRIAVASDPANWDAFIADEPVDQLCASGFIHGIAIAAFNEEESLDDEVLEREVPRFRAACTRRGDALGGLGCSHALGHLLIYATGRDLRRSLEWCDRIYDSDHDRATRCHSGAGMQFFLDPMPEDYARLADLSLTKDSVVPFCTKLENPAYVGACLRGSRPLFEPDITNGTGLDAFCALQPNAEQTNLCYGRMFTSMGCALADDRHVIKESCLSVNADRRLDCFSVNAQAILALGGGAGGVQEALQVCTSAGDHAPECMNRLMATAADYESAGSDGRAALCRAFPTNIEDRCLNMP